MDITADNSVSSETTQVGSVDISRISKRNREQGTPDLQTSNGNENIHHNEIVLTAKEKLLQLKRREAEAMRQLRPEYRKLLQHARASLGSNELQSRRMRRAVVTLSNAKSTEELSTVEEIKSELPSENTITTPSITKEKLKLYQKLHKSIYTESAVETVASNILQRQLNSLLAVKGFTKDEIKLVSRTHAGSDSNNLNEMVKADHTVDKTTRYSVSATGNRADVGTTPPIVSIKRQMLTNSIEDSQSIQSSLENRSIKHADAYITASHKLEAEIMKRKLRQEQAKERVRSKLASTALASSSPVSGNTNIEAELAAMKLEQELELRKQRQLQARDKAKQLEANRVARLKQNIVSSSASTKNVNGADGSDMNDLLESMELLQHKLHETNLSSTSMFAIKKQLAILNSKVIKLKRKPVEETVEIGVADDQLSREGEEDRAVY
jgi:hypothetical protein